MILKMAWRNIWRHRRRTYITLASVAFGVWLTVSSVGIADFSYEQMINDSARMGFGHVTVQPEGYQAAPSLRKTITHTSTTLAELHDMPDVDDAVVRITGQAMLASASRSVGGGFIAVDPSQENAVVNLLIRTLKRGKMFESTDGRGAIVGESMAEKLDIDLGKKFVITAIDKNGDVVSELLRVKGIYRTGVPEVDGAMVLMPIDRARSMLHYGPDEATMISAYINDYRASSHVRTEIAKLIPPSAGEVQTWRQTQVDMASLSDLDRGMNILFLALLGMLIAAGVLNTSLMSVLERRQEFGMMMAIGLRPGQLWKMVMTESMFVAVIGLLVGAAICVPWVIYLLQVGIDLSDMFTDYNASGVVMDPVIRIKLYWTTVAGISGALFLLTILAGLYPAISAARVPPIEVIKDVA